MRDSVLVATPDQFTTMERLNIKLLSLHLNDAVALIDDKYSKEHINAETTENMRLDYINICEYYKERGAIKDYKIFTFHGYDEADYCTLKIITHVFMQLGNVEEYVPFRITSVEVT